MAQERLIEIPGAPAEPSRQTSKSIGAGDIVLLDNDGGGIFHFLPVASQGAAFEEHVATPHGLDFAHAAALYGLGWERAQDVDSFRAALGRALSSDRSTIVCVRTDRAENVELHRRVWESVRAAT